MSHVRGKPHPRVCGPSDRGNRSTSRDFNNSLCSMHRNTHSSKLILGVALVT